MSDYKINSFGTSIFRGVNHGEKPDETSHLLNKLKHEFLSLHWTSPITIAVKYVNTKGDIAKLTFEDVVTIRWIIGSDICEIEYQSGYDYITIEILKADVMAIDEIIKPTPLTAKSRRVQ